MTQKFKFVFERIENNLGKEEEAVCQYFLLFQECFPKLSSWGCLKSGLCANQHF